jgi:hypothetical protein
VRFDPVLRLPKSQNRSQLPNPSQHTSQLPLPNPASFLERRFRGVWHLARQFYVSATYPARWTSFTPAPEVAR